MTKAKRRTRGQEVEARRSDRRRELLDAAIRAIRRNGPRVSMREMAAEAGVTKPILYRHFGAKGGLYHAIAERYATELLEEIRSVLGRDLPAQSLLVAALDAYLGFLERETEVHRFLMERALPERPETGQAFVTGFRGQVAEELERALRDRVTPSGREEAVGPWAHALVGMAESAGEWWLHQDRISREELVDYLARLLWTGFSGITEGLEPKAGVAPIAAVTGRPATTRAIWEEAQR
jgi:AcrR family transcriptional regulator